ncbi:MAG: hypothetical protein ABSC37_13425 [Xanthobacteraceae bacterium]
MFWPRGGPTFGRLPDPRCRAVNHGDSSDIGKHAWNVEHLPAFPDEAAEIVPGLDEFRGGTGRLIAPA